MEVVEVEAVSECLDGVVAVCSGVDTVCLGLVWVVVLVELGCVAVWLSVCWVESVGVIELCGVLSGLWDICGWVGVLYGVLYGVL